MHRVRIHPIHPGGLTSHPMRPPWLSSILWLWGRSLCDEMETVGSSHYTQFEMQRPAEMQMSRRSRCTGICTSDSQTRASGRPWMAVC
ncbi:hypothetical protein CGRA01v4_14984 [Colletotrichum graminicola]|nr:hypothetical protein CGRA01v4_14984 [Colletotrichum graminicola]